jgi:predicted secreted protein
MSTIPFIVRQLSDRRSRNVIFLSHCLLNENTRYLGGACTAGCIREIFDECLQRDLGIIQMPCPEEVAWGGVLKRRLLALYGMNRSRLRFLLPVLLPLALWYTRYLYRGIVRQIAEQIDDYRQSGYNVSAVVGVDGSPSCGVGTTLDIHRAFDQLADLDTTSMTVETINEVVLHCTTEGEGMFMVLLHQELRRQGINIPFLAHDLINELKGEPTRFSFP